MGLSFSHLMDALFRAEKTFINNFFKINIPVFGYAEMQFILQR